MKTVISIVCLGIVIIAFFVIVDYGYGPDYDKPRAYERCGVIKSALFVSSSFNAQDRTQITTDKMIISVIGSPNLRIGDTLKIYYSKNRIFILDCMNEPYKIKNR